MRHRLLILAVILAAVGAAAWLLGVRLEVKLFPPNSFEATVESSWLADHAPALGLRSNASLLIWAGAAAGLLVGLIAALGRRRR